MSRIEGTRMIHIRLEEEVHRDLRRAAAEEDTSLQELVSRVVSGSVTGGRFVEMRCVSSPSPGGERTLTLTVDERDEEGDVPVRTRLERIRELLGGLQAEVDGLARIVGEGSDDEPV